MGPTLGSSSVWPGYRPVHLLIGFEVLNAEHERPALAHVRTLRQVRHTGREGSGSCGWQPLPQARLAGLLAPFDGPLPLVCPFHAAQLVHALTNRIRSHPRGVSARRVSYAAGGFSRLRAPRVRLPGRSSLSRRARIMKSISDVSVSTQWSFSLCWRSMGILVES